MEPVRKVEISLNDFFKSSALCVLRSVLRSEINTLVTISNIWNSNGDREYPGKDFYGALAFVEISITLICILGICDAGDSQCSSTEKKKKKGNSLAMDQKFVKKKKV